MTDGNPEQQNADSQAEVKDELSTLVKEGEKTNDLNEVVSFVREQKTKDAGEQFRTAMDDAVKVITEAVPEDMRKLADAELIEGFLHKKASEDEKVKSDFINRHTNPSAWKETQGKLAKEFGKRFENAPDEKVNADREAVIASAKTQGKAEEVEETMESVAAMSPDDFAKLQQKHGLRPYGT